MKKDSLGIGVIGLGTHARRGHLDHFANLKGAHLAGVCDPDPTARADLVNDEVSGYAYPEELLASSAVDAVIICSPDRFHFSTLAATVEAGKHVLVEKPVVNTTGELEELPRILHQAQVSGLVVSSCHPRRFDRPFLAVRDRLPELADQLGVALELRFDFFYHRPSKVGLHQGLLIDHVNHEIDLVNWLFGYSPFVAHRLFDSQTRYGVAGWRKDGLTFSFSGSRHLERHVYAETMEIRFERGLLEVDAETGVLRVHDYDRNQVVETHCGPTDYDGRFISVNQDFVDAIRCGGNPYLAAADLVLNTETGIALTETGVYDSAASDALVTLLG